MAGLDPNGTTQNPVDRWVWIAPDWSDVQEDAPKAPKPGYQHVKVRESRYNDGRIVTQVLDENGRPVSDENGPRPPIDSSTDAKQAGVFTAQAPKPLPPGAAPTQRQPDGSINAYNPATGAYDTPTGAVVATRTPEQRTVDQAAAAKATQEQHEREANNALPADQDPAYETNAERAARAERTIAQQRADANTAADNKRADDAAAQAAATKSRTNPTNSHFEEFDPATGQWVDRGPIQKAPVIRPNPVTGEDEQVQEVPDGNGGTKLVVKPIERQGGNPAVPAGAPEVDLSTPDNAYSSFMRLYQWATQQVATGKQTPTWLENTLKGPHEAVTLALNREATKKQEQQQQTQDALTQRAQDITQTGGRLSAATSGFGQALTSADETNKLAGPGINAASSTLLGELALQRINAQQMGGMETPPPVVPGPMNALPTYPGAAPVAAAAAKAAPAGPTPVFRPMAPTNVQPATVAASSSGAVPSAAVSAPPSAPVLVPAPGLSPAVVNATTGTTDDLINGLTVAPGRAPGDQTGYGTMNLPQGQDLSTPIPTNPDGSGDPVGMAPPVYPTMAMASSLKGRPAYDPVIASMRAAGLSQEAIDAAMAAHLQGAAA